MNLTSLTLWSSLLQKRDPSFRDPLMNCLTAELQDELSVLPSIACDSSALCASTKTELDAIHYSWFAPFLRSLTEREIKLFLSALNPKQIKGLKQTLLLSNTIPSTSATGIRYLQQTLYQSIAPSDLLPLSCLPDDPLNALVCLSFEQLLSLIHLLAMHDLAVEIRHIIDTVQLKEIYSLLSKPQTTFLKSLLHKKETVSFKKIGLSNWRRDHEALDHILTQRGINRLAKALYKRHKSLAWHVAHCFDMEKGQLLLNLSTALDHPKAYDILSEQVVELIDALNNETTDSKSRLDL